MSKKPISYRQRRKKSVNPYQLHILTSYKEEASGWLALPTSDHIVPGLNLAGGRIQLMTMACHCTEPVIVILPSSQYDLNNVECDVKHQTIIISHKVLG